MLSASASGLRPREDFLGVLDSVNAVEKGDGFVQEDGHNLHEKQLAEAG